MCTHLRVIVRSLALAIFWPAMLSVLVVASVWAYNPHAERDVVAGVLPPELEGLEFNEHLGEKIDLGLSFVDEQGQPVQLARYFGDKPVLMALVYYGCPNLCNFQLNGLVQAMQRIRLKAGRDYEFVAVSIHPGEGPELASKKKANYLKELATLPAGLELGTSGAGPSGAGPSGAGSSSAGPSGAGPSRAGVLASSSGVSSLGAGAVSDVVTARGWHLLTGVPENIEALARQVGFSYKWSQKTQQYAHAAMTYVLTPEGVISRYLYGVQFEPQTLTLSLVEASYLKVASVVERILLFCFQFDPSLNKYTLYAYNMMRLGALLVLLTLLILLGPMWWREYKRSRML